MLFRKKNLVRILSFVLLLVILSFWASPFRAIFINTLKTPLVVFSLIGREVKGIIFYHRNFIQNAALNKENEILRNRLNANEEIIQENKRLKDLLSFKQSQPQKLIASRVIGRLGDTWSSSIIIDKGGSNGLRRGMVCLTHLGLIGRIVETTKNTSKVLLINDPSLSVSCVAQRSRQEGLVSGTLGSYLIMRYLPEGADIKVRDTIVTSGMNSLYPKGILVGEVAGIGKQFSGLSLYCLIKPAVNLSNIEEVLVISSE